jgi:hypothetical protein
VVIILLSVTKKLITSGSMAVTLSVHLREAAAGRAASPGRARIRADTLMTRRSAVPAHGGMVPGISRKAMLKRARNVGETALPCFPGAKTAKLDNHRDGHGETGLPVR